MFSRGKYIVGHTNRSIDGIVAVIFPDSIDHIAMASDVFHRDVKHKVLGAGFVYVNADGRLCATGESVTLGVKAREADSLYLRRAVGDLREALSDENDEAVNFRRQQRKDLELVEERLKGAHESA